MNLRHIQTFITVAEQGTVSKAALRLRIAQPALSRQINDFEAELGIKLFDRIHKRLTLTGAGERLLIDCHNVQNAIALLSSRARLLSISDAGILNIASTMLDEILATFLHRYAKCFPHVQIKLNDIVGPADLFARLESGELHLGIGLRRSVQAETHRFESYPLPPIEFLAVGHASLALGSAGNIEVTELAPYSLLLLTPSFEVRKSFDGACRLAGFTPRIFMESRAAHTLLTLAEAGHGVAIVPAVLPIHRYRLNIARITHRGRALQEPLTVLWDGQRVLAPYATSFCELLDAYMREVFPIMQQPEPTLTRGAKRRLPRRT